MIAIVEHTAMEYKIHSYVDRIANGDPVIVYSPETGAITLGTGFESFEAIRREIERCTDIELTGVEFDVFGIDGHISFENE